LTGRSRSFEILVAQVEEALGPAGVKVSSPDRIPDARTGRKREVDASLRYTVGSVEVLVTIECRDRSRAPDITWIEQLHSKQLAIRASKTIAVSSRPFSKDALRVAQHHGIETRVLAEVTGADILRWADKIELRAQRATLSNLSLTIETSDNSRVEGPVGSWLGALLAADGFDAHFLSLSADTQLRSPIDVLRQRARVLGRLPEDAEGWARVTLPPKSGIEIGDPGYFPFTRGLKTDGSTAAREVPVEFEPGAAFIRFGEEQWEIRRLVLRCDVRCKGVESPSTRTLTYQHPTGALAEVAHRTIDAGGGSQIVISDVRVVEGKGKGDAA
jgi:hypothetical protein